MGNIVIAIAKGDVTEKLNPTFHYPKVVLIQQGFHTIYMRKWGAPEGVTEVWNRDIDAYGIDNIPPQYAIHFKAYLQGNVKAF